jgi:hypothetical protein
MIKKHFSEERLIKVTNVRRCYVDGSEGIVSWSENGEFALSRECFQYGWIRS